VNGNVCNKRRTKVTTKGAAGDRHVKRFRAVQWRGDDLKKPTSEVPEESSMLRALEKKGPLPTFGAKLGAERNNERKAGGGEFAESKKLLPERPKTDINSEVSEGMETRRRINTVRRYPTNDGGVR